MTLEALDEIEATLRAADWPKALTFAIGAWRATRDPELADLVDRVTARCELPAPPHTRSAHHRWWIQHARDPDPVTVGALLATFAIRKQVDRDTTWAAMKERWPDNPIIAAIDAMPPPAYLLEHARRSGLPIDWPGNVPSWIERLAAIVAWPDDPRVSRVLVDFLADADVVFYAPQVVVTSSGNVGVTAICRTIADRLIALADVRIVPALTRLSPATYPTYKQRIVGELLPSIHAGLERPTRSAPEIRARVASLATKPSASAAVDLDTLWRQVADHPDDLAPRLVLADALLAAGDSRGELISLQCSHADNPASAGTRAHRLIRTSSRRWLGDLAQVLTRKAPCSVAACSTRCASDCTLPHRNCGRRSAVTASSGSCARSDRGTFRFPTTSRCSPACDGFHRRSASMH